MRGYELCWRVLNAADIGSLFTLTADGIMELVAEAIADGDDNGTVVSVRHEQAAVAMADAYGRATGDLGVCVIGRGPAIAQTGRRTDDGPKGQFEPPNPDRGIRARRPGRGQGI